ncbi:MAG: EscU/YscU/HrcU family type III secretion system export apparatus switch protein [Opitutales bacterium]
MPDVDKSSKTEEPTEKRLNDSRSRGQFAKAPEIGVTFTLAAGVITILAFGIQKAEILGMFTRSIFENIDNFKATQEGIVNVFSMSYFTMASIVLPMLIFCFIAALVAEGLQTGFRFTPKALEPKLDKLNPVNGAKRIFGSQALITFGIDFLKFFAIGTVVVLTIRYITQDPIFYAPVPIKHVGVFIYNLFIIMLLILALLMAIIAIINYLIQKRKHKKELMMTREEVKEERRSREVSSEVKTTQRKKALEFTARQSLDDVPTADVVVTNPTHFAVALRYQRGADLAPIVVAKGEQLLARRIKMIAKEYEVPLVENKSVARTLYHVGRIGLPIPFELYQVVAEILAFVYRAHGYYFHRLKARRIVAKG